LAATVHPRFSDRLHRGCVSSIRDLAERRRPRAAAHVQQPEPPGRGEHRHTRHHRSRDGGDDRALQPLDREEKLRAADQVVALTGLRAPANENTAAPTAPARGGEVGD